jgi:sigma-B regulation protein RsbU (phosphoserine phosphatase)
VTDAGAIRDSASPAAPTPLTALVNLTTLQHLQDRFAALGRMTVCICTTDGEPITRPMWGSRYSELIGTSRIGWPIFLNAVRACVRDPNPEAQQKCLEGMMVHVVPIQRGDQPLASIAIATRRHNPPRDDVVRSQALKYEVDVEELLAAAVRLNPWRGATPEAIHRFADVLAHIISTLYGQADRINRQLADLQTVHSLAELLSGNVELQAILDLTVKRVVEVMSVKACAIRLHNKQTDELVIKAVHNLSAEYLRKGPVLLRNSPIDSAAFAGESVYIENAPTDSRMRYPDNARKEGIVSGLCVPLAYRGNTVGVLRVYTGRPYRFSGAEESLLRSIASQSAAAIVHTRMYDEKAEAERVKRQIDAAAQIQRRMLPARPPNHPSLALGCVYDPSLAVGGDFYDFFPLPDGRMGVCIADVMGKGLPAAMLMASIRASLRAHAGVGVDPDQTLARVNFQMHTDTLVHEFATLVYCVFSADGRMLTYSNAGHPPPLLLRGERFIELEAGGLAIGVEPEERFEQESVRLESGDTLIMVTDGVMEAMDYHGAVFGRERLLAAIWRYRDLDAASLARQVLWEVRRFAGLADQSDDITVVVVKAN